jgi:hypothetical protein
MSSSLTALAVFEAATDRGLRFHLGLGVASEGRFVGSVALAQLSYSWGLRYRTRDGRAGIGGMPDWYLDYFMVDPILEADGCIYTDPSSIGRLKIICVGTPDLLDASTIVHNDGHRFPVGLHVWIDKTDGTLMTEDRQILAKPDAKTAQLAIVVQQLAEVVKRREQKTGKPCFLQGGVLHTVSDASLAAMVALDDQGSGASLLGYELARMIFCDAEPLAGGLPPLPFGKGLRGGRSVAGEKVRDIIEHDRPAAPPNTPSAPAKPAPGNSPPPSPLQARHQRPRRMPRPRVKPQVSSPTRAVVTSFTVMSILSAAKQPAGTTNRAATKPKVLRSSTALGAHLTHTVSTKAT